MEEKVKQSESEESKESLVEQAYDILKDSETLIEKEQDQTKDLVDYSKQIFHVQQAGMQCWARSSQMFLSYILSQLGFSKGQIGSIFYKKMFLHDESITDKDYELINQYILGRNRP